MDPSLKILRYIHCRVIRRRLIECRVLRLWKGLGAGLGSAWSVICAEVNGSLEDTFPWRLKGNHAQSMFSDIWKITHKRAAQLC